MDEYEVLISRIETISTAIQTIKESLTCGICLELFNIPVTIKCGHKFCRLCILKVTNNENSSCPFCNTKIHKRSIPKQGNPVFQRSVEKLENLIKAIEVDSGIDVLYSYNKAKNTKESPVVYSKINTSKLEDIASTSKRSSLIFNETSTEAKVANLVKSRLSLTKEKADIESPSQNSKDDSLDKDYLSNKSDLKHDKIVQPQKKVKRWLENYTSEDIINGYNKSDSIIKDTIREPNESFEKKLTTDQAGTLPDQIYCSSPNNKIKEYNASSVPLSKESSKFKETEIRIQEAEKMMKKKKMSLNAKENDNLRTPSSVPITSQLDTCNWRTVKQVGREMQVKTFKTLNVSVEKYPPSVAVDDTVLYNSTNNDSKSILHDSKTNNTSADKTPPPTNTCYSLKSKNDNRLKKSSQIIIEEYKRRSMDSTDSPKPNCITGFDVDENRLNEIIGVVSSTNVSKTLEKSTTLSTESNESDLNFLIEQSSPSEHKLSEQKLSTDASPNSNNNTTAIYLLNSSSKKNQLSLKNLKNNISTEQVSVSDNLGKTDHIDKESSFDKSNSNKQEISSIKPSLCNILVKKGSSSIASGCRVIFQKLGKICKKRKNVPFLYLGRLENEKCLFVNRNLCKKSGIVVKSNIPVSMNYKSSLNDKNITNLEFSNKSDMKLSLSQNNVPLKSPTKPSTINNYSEAMNIDENLDVQKTCQSNQQMEIDEMLPTVEMVVKNKNSLKIENSASPIDLEKVEDFSLKISKTERNLENEDFEKILPQIDETIPKSLRNIDAGDISKNSKTELEKPDSVSKSSSKVDKVENLINFNQKKLSNSKERLENINVSKVPEDLISINVDSTEKKFHSTNRRLKIGKGKLNETCRKNTQKINISDVESSTESEASVTFGTEGEKIVKDKKDRYSSALYFSFKTTRKKKRTHSESSDEDVNHILKKWDHKPKISFDTEKEQAIKRQKISIDSEEIINRNASKVKRKSRYSFSSSSSDYEGEIFKDNEHDQNSTVNGMVSKIKQNTEVNGNKLTTIPSSLLSSNLFESNGRSILPMQSLKKQSNEFTVQNTSTMDSNSEKENISEDSLENITIIDAKQSSKRKSAASKNVDYDNRENNQCNQTSRFKKLIKLTEGTADEIESSQNGKTSIVLKNIDNDDKENNKQKQTTNFNKLMKNPEVHVDEIESSQKDNNKTVDNFECESNPYFVRESLLNITQEQIACKNIEKDLFGIDLSKIHENRNDDHLDNAKSCTPCRKSTTFEENDDFDSDSIAPTPVIKRRHTLRFPSPESSPKSDIHESTMFSPVRKMSLIPAITPMKNTNSYPLCHSTPMVNMDSPDSPDNITHPQIENIRIVYTSLTVENIQLLQTFASTFNVQLKSNFDLGVTHVVVKVDPLTKIAPKTFKYIQGIAFKKYVVSFEWITDCLAKNKLLDADDEKYDVLDPDIFKSGCRKSRQSTQKLFKNFVFCCFGLFMKVRLDEFKELLTYTGSIVVSSIKEFNFHKNKLNIIIIETEDFNDKAVDILTKADAATVHLEWVVDSLSQFQLLSIHPYLCGKSLEKAKSLGFPPELLVEEDTSEEVEDDN
ncbi:breast cancer type 1 susceptibility protein-like [Phymastichus coffea]|uniref:breast cancer type 1 susceptibility protein-like n=1 Tax=Phymastichus coffea TaxID=108790 RepID=UPI00273AE31F|nr:breast cancer type 1 susceptibility protein-like [Phymastichus coffea]